MSYRDEVIEALRNARSEPNLQRAVYALEDLLTPNELKDSLPVVEGLGDSVRALLRASFTVRHIRAHDPQVYVRHHLRSDLAFYEGAPSPAGRGLLFVLCGRLPRPMMSNALFVQHVPAQLFDVVVMADASNNHYANGIEGYADSLFALKQRLADDFNTSRYERVYFYGVSSGGLAAVRLGLMSKAFRSIAIGGLFAWPIQRLRNGEAFQTFDPICACNPGHRDDVICVHASKHRDANAARQVMTAIGAQGLRITSTEDHNVLHQLFLQGKLDTLHERLLGFHYPRGRAEFVPSA